MCNLYATRCVCTIYTCIKYVHIYGHNLTGSIALPRDMVTRGSVNFIPGSSWGEKPKFVGHRISDTCMSHGRGTHELVCQGSMHLRGMHRIGSVPGTLWLQPWWPGNPPGLAVRDEWGCKPYNMKVSINGGTLKWMVRNGKSFYQMDDLVVPLFEETII